MNGHNEHEIAAFTITGRSDQPATVEALASTLLNAMEQFSARFGRLPDDPEADALWAAVQRFHGVPETLLEPASQRRQ